MSKKEHEIEFLKAYLESGRKYCLYLESKGHVVFVLEEIVTKEGFYRLIHVTSKTAFSILSYKSFVPKWGN